MTATGKSLNHRRTFHRRLPHRRAFTLTELAIIMAVIGSVLASIWVVMGNLRQQHQAEQASTQILAIVNNFHALYSNGRSITNVGTTDVTGLAIKNGYVPPEMIVAGNDITARSPWSTNVIVQTNQSWNAIVVTYQTLSRTACNRLAATTFNDDGGLVSTNINGTSRTLPPLGTNAAFTITEIDALCIAGSTNYVSVAYSMN